MLRLYTLRQAIPSARALNTNNILRDGIRAKHFDSLPTVKKYLGLVDLEILRYPPNKVHELFVERKKQLGDMYMFAPTVFHMKRVIINTPELLSELSSKEGKYPSRGQISKLLLKAKYSAGLPAGMIGEGDEWKRSRDPLSKRFLRPRFMADYIPTFSKIARETVRDVVQMSKGGKSDFNQIIERLSLWTIDSACFLLFHRERTPEVTAEVIQFISSIREIVRSSFDLKWSDSNPYLARKSFKTLVDSCKFLVYYAKKQMKISNEKPQDPNRANSTLLEYLQNETDFDDMDIIDSFASFLGGSLDTTTISTQWLWYNLSKSPTAQDRVCEEVHSVVGDSLIITTEHYNKLHYIKWCMKESMRLTPTATMFSRVLQGNSTLGGVSMPRGTLVMADLYGMGLDERYWREPREFLPERWENRSDVDPFSYIPFGVGPRMCIGRRLAEAEMQLITAQLCRDYRLHLLQEPESSFESLLVPKGLNLSFEKRV